MASISRLLCSMVVALAFVSPAPFALADDGGDGPMLRVPGFPPVPMPPGAPGFGQRRPKPTEQGDRPDADIYHEFGTVTPGGGARQRGRTQDSGGLVIGPGGVVKPVPRPQQAKPKPRVLTPEEKQAEIRKALRPQTPLAIARRKTLDDLYAKLAASRDEGEAKGLASLISAVWARSGSDTANLLMARAEMAVGTKNFPLALSVLNKVVTLQPNWAEGWNRRASVRYMAGDLNGAMADVDHVLKIEPKHFAALNGLAMILEQTGFDKRALQVYRRLLAIYPHQPEVEKTIDKLSAQVEGQGI